jgi:hypothetical protein
MVFAEAPVATLDDAAEDDVDPSMKPVELSTGPPFGIPPIIANSISSSVYYQSLSRKGGRNQRVANRLTIANAPL